MRIKYFLFMVVAILQANVYAFDDLQGNVFNYAKATYDNMELPYRVASLNGDMADDPALVIYLHGGTSKGNDNIKQLAEPGIDSIYNYICKKKLNALFVVPQCPSNKSWGGTMNSVVKSLIDEFVVGRKVNSDRIYIFGGSMGGSGTWGLVSAYPGLFTAAMPVAGNPSKCNVEAVAKTPVYTVMGTADAIMKIDVVDEFINDLRGKGGDVKYEIEDGWTHEMTCIQSYTEERLDWIFSHSKDASVDDVLMTEDCIEQIDYYTMDGVHIPKPESQGVYIVRTIYANGKVSSVKVLIR